MILLLSSIVPIPRPRWSKALCKCKNSVVLGAKSNSSAKEWQKKTTTTRRELTKTLKTRSTRRTRSRRRARRTRGRRRTRRRRGERTRRRRRRGGGRRRRRERTRRRKTICKNQPTPRNCICNNRNHDRFDGKLTNDYCNNPMNMKPVNYKLLLVLCTSASSKMLNKLNTEIVTDFHAW